MTTTTTYTIPKVRKGTNLPYFGLSTISFLIPFNYINTSDVVVAMRGNLNDTSAKDDVLLIERTNYSLNGSMLTIDEQSLNLDATDSLDVVLSATRNTDINFAIYHPGHPIKAADLNDNFEQLFLRTEELNTLVLNNTYVSDTAPVNPYKGQTWLRTPYYTHFIFDGVQFVQPQ